MRFSFFLPRWLLALLTAAGLLLLAQLLPHCTSGDDLPGRLSRRQQRQLRAQATASQQQAAADTLRATRAARQARPHYDSARAAAHRAHALRQQTHPYVSPPASAPDAAARQLQRLLSTY